MNFELVCDIDFAGQGQEVAQPLLVFHDKFLSLPDLEFGRSARVLASSQYKQILAARYCDASGRKSRAGKVCAGVGYWAMAYFAWPMEWVVRDHWRLPNTSSGYEIGIGDQRCYF